MPLNRKQIEDFFNNEGSRIYNEAEKAIDKFSMRKAIEKGVLVGLSGGADSVLLLCFMIEYRRRNNCDFSIASVHIHHGIRGSEADRDEEFCHKLCHGLGVEYICRKFDVPFISKNTGVSLEEAARNVRYNAFKEIISGRKDIDTIAVAHNRSDSTETVLFNILRGSGSKGACGISPVRDKVIRPLIEISKKDIIDALNLACFPYVTDSTNLSVDYSRNYIRNEIMPVLRKISNDPEKMISRFSDNLRSDDEFITSFANDFLEKNRLVTNKALLRLHPSVFVRVIKRMSEACGAGVSSKILNDIRSNLVNDNFTYSLIGGRFICNRGICSISDDTQESIDYLVFLSDGVNSIDEIGVEVSVSSEPFNKSYLNVYKNSIQADISSAIIIGRAYFRPKKNGDTIYYGGMTHKLKKLFNDRKIPLSLRKKLPVLCDQNGVVWVPGFGVRDDGVPENERKSLYVLLGEKTYE